MSEVEVTGFYEFTIHPLFFLEAQGLQVFIHNSPFLILEAGIEGRFLRLDINFFVLSGRGRRVSVILQFTLKE